MEPSHFGLNFNLFAMRWAVCLLHIWINWAINVSKRYCCISFCFTDSKARTHTHTRSPLIHSEHCTPSVSHKFKLQQINLSRIIYAQSEFLFIISLEFFCSTPLRFGLFYSLAVFSQDIGIKTYLKDNSDFFLSKWIIHRALQFVSDVFSHTEVEYLKVAGSN